MARDNRGVTQHPASPPSSPSLSRRLSCGIVVLSETRELLLCHVTGQRQWDLPKGCPDAGETPLDAAVREAREETGLAFAAEALTDLGRLAYTAKKDLHLFATLTERFDTRLLHCTSHFSEHGSGRSQPEMDGFGWFAFSEIEKRCVPNMAAVLMRTLDLEALLADLSRQETPRLAA